MKRTLLLIAIILMVGKLPAQTLHTLIQPDENYIETRGMMETRDGNIIVNCPVFVPKDGWLVDWGFYLYKVSPQAQILDSVFIENDDVLWFLMERNPLNDNNNILATMHRHPEDTTTTLNIRFFNDNLEFEEEEYDILVQDTILSRDRYYLDANNDIIVLYSKYNGNSFYMARVGLDGTIKTHVKMTDIDYTFNTQINNFGLYNKSPLQYCYWISNFESGQIENTIVDSMFNVVEQHKYDSHYVGGAYEQIMYYDEDTYIFSSNRDPGGGGTSYVHVSKFNKNHEYLYGKAFYGPNPGLVPFPIRVDKSKKEGIYYSWVTTAAGSQVAVVKMDDDFNIEWERYCLDDNGIFHWGNDMITLDNGGVAVGGWDSSSGVFQIFLLILTDDGLTTPEMEDFVRPFCIYPNPSKDYVNIKISPDVRCEKAELYDITGRLHKSYGSTSGTSIQFDVQDLPAGNYILNITLDNGKSYSEKVVITE